jgi:hypothetical protein
MAMGRLVTSNSKDRDLTADPADRSFLITRGAPSNGQPFGGTRVKGPPVQASRAVARASGFFKNMFQAIAGARMRRGGQAGSVSPPPTKGASAIGSPRLRGVE